jgi:hypothetical protein
VLRDPPTFRSNINVLFLACGLFKGSITQGERYFLRSLGRYGKGMLPVCGPKSIIAFRIARDNDQLLGDQTFLCHFPKSLQIQILRKPIAGVPYGKNRNTRKEIQRSFRDVYEGGIIRRSRPCLFQTGRQPMCPRR